MKDRRGTVFVPKDTPGIDAHDGRPRRGYSDPSKVFHRTRMPKFTRSESFAKIEQALRILSLSEDYDDESHVVPYPTTTRHAVV